MLLWRGAMIRIIVNAKHLASVIAQRPRPGFLRRAYKRFRQPRLFDYLCQEWEIAVIVKHPITAIRLYQYTVTPRQRRSLLGARLAIRHEALMIIRLDIIFAIVRFTHGIEADIRIIQNLPIGDRQQGSVIPEQRIPSNLFSRFIFGKRCVKCPVDIRVQLMKLLTYLTVRHRLFVIRYGGLRFQVQQSVDGFELVAR
ncbi:hypothetical protein B7453_29375 [Pseudomonas sp. IB20]|nr:hypothetical protein B7453_29375 [Pseudomonas sp. IB20]